MQRLVLHIALVFSLLIAFGCDETTEPDTPGTDDPAARRTSVCERDDAPESCFWSCENNTDCKGATYCRGNSFCFADCTSDNDCKGKLTCDAQGRCVLDEPPVLCAPQPIEVRPVIPNLVVLIDRSESMNQAFGSNSEPANSSNNPTRWQSVSQALFGENGDDGVLHSVHGIARIGLATFASTESNDQGYCADVESTNNLALYGASPAQSVYKSGHPYGGTPTGQSIYYLRKHKDGLLKKISDNPTLSKNPTVLILATDGAPTEPSDNTCPGTSFDPEAFVVNQVRAAYNEGIQTFVVGVAFDNEHLNDVARAGQNNPYATYVPANTPQQLEAAIRKIVKREIGCKLKLEKPLSDEARACQFGQVTIDDIKLTCDDLIGGWKVVDANTIELTGTSCAKWNDNELHTLTATFPCNAVSAE